MIYVLCKEERCSFCFPNTAMQILYHNKSRLQIAQYGVIKSLLVVTFKTLSLSDSVGG